MELTSRPILVTGPNSTALEVKRRPGNRSVRQQHYKYYFAYRQVVTFEAKEKSGSRPKLVHRKGESMISVKNTHNV